MYIAVVVAFLLGFLASGAAGLLLLVFFNILLPAIIQQFFSRHQPSIAGKWITEYREGDAEMREEVTVRQRGSKIRGQIALRSKDETDIYRFEGTFKNLILTGTYESTDPEDIERGVFLLNYARGKLTGQYARPSRESDEMISSRYVWQRPKSKR